MKYAMDWAGIPYPAPEVFRSFIGPSLYDSFANTLHMDDAQAKEMVAKYRERYNVIGLFEAEVYDGVAETLEKLKKSGCILSVATSKPTEPTLRILEKFGVRKYFDVVVGSNPDGTGSINLFTHLPIRKYFLHHFIKELVIISPFRPRPGGSARVCPRT